MLGVGLSGHSGGYRTCLGDRLLLSVHVPCHVVDCICRLCVRVCFCGARRTGPMVAHSGLLRGGTAHFYYRKTPFEIASNRLGWELNRHNTNVNPCYLQL